MKNNEKEVKCSNCEEGRIEVEPGDGIQRLRSCAGCGCSYDVEVKQGRAVRVLEEYAPGSSANDGGMPVLVFLT